MALLESASLPGAETEDLLDQARVEVEQMRALVDDILFLSELESGREVVSLGSTEALPVLEEVRDRLADRAERADVAIVLEVEPETTLPLRRRMLQVVVENLADNAIRYAGPRATLTLRARAGVLEAEDDGPGVDEADLPRLFERFYRADRARASRGTGLGLAIVKHVVTAAGGQVDASTGPGLRVTCSFPS
jgi:two-component system phosphate regulon sensor histidine kinase PhoR